MIKKFVLALVFFMAPSLASALVITEVMHSPTQGSDTNLEWIEIYNDEDTSIDLSSWKIDNSNFDDYVIVPGEYLVIAKKLTGANESFESVWGNNNGVWDDGFSAVDGSFSLTETDTINLSNGIVSVIAGYDASAFSNGATAILVNESYVEGTLNGTPGYPEYSSDEVAYYYDSLNSRPEIISINLSDDYDKEGFQFNAPRDSRQVEITVNATDANSDTLLVKAIFGGIESNLHESNGLYRGNITIGSNAESSNLTIIVDDGYESSESAVRIEIIRTKSYSLSSNAIKFSKSNLTGESSAAFNITNKGNSPARYYLIATGNGDLPEININGNWIKLSNEIELPELMPDESYTVKLRVKSTALKKGRYYGRIKVSIR